ncbi:mitochondrial coenzyme A diphosphatase NUDT8-like [Symsagittifera roscoffensis]|uniref:mitochondrial coenzyme A diphosphatase NUDT8-like n=1 Tax=Symsagittifera roscoffensis TaxID=84072 RepID=UPI00307BA270
MKHVIATKLSRTFPLLCGRPRLNSGLNRSLKTNLGQNNQQDLNEVLSDLNKKRVQNVLEENNRLVQKSISRAGKSEEEREFGSAVLVPFCTYRDKPSILYTVRSRNLISHRNDLSFPGGKVEDQDNKDLVRTAVRECCEELDIHKDQIDVWGHVLRDAKYIRRRYLTIPVIANLGRIEDLKLKMEHPTPEVESILIVPLDYFLAENSTQRYTVYKMVYPREGEVDKYRNTLFTHPQKRIWGMCANFTAALLPIMHPPFEHHLLQHKFFK